MVPFARKKMGTEVISSADSFILEEPTDAMSSSNSPPSSSTALSSILPPLERPFKIIVQNKTILINSENLRKLSPVFSVMCYGKDFENGRELSREIVDEKSEDVMVFLEAITHPRVISGQLRQFRMLSRANHCSNSKANEG